MVSGHAKKALLMAKPLRKIQTQDRILETIQENVSQAHDSVAKSIELNPSYIDVATVASTDMIVNHLLNRQFQYYSIVRSDADVRVWDSSTINTNPSKQLIIRASGTANITIKVT